jgi:siroheme synthase
VLLSASSAAARTWIGTLGELTAEASALNVDVAPGDAPGTIVVGQVVSLAYQLGAHQLGAAQLGPDAAVAARGGEQKNEAAG